MVLERKNIAPMKTGALICYEATLVLSEGTGPQFFLPAFTPGVELYSLCDQIFILPYNYTPNPRFLRTLGPPNIGSAKIEGAKIKVIVM